MSYTTFNTAFIKTGAEDRCGLRGNVAGNVWFRRFIVCLQLAIDVISSLCFCAVVKVSSFIQA